MQAKQPEGARDFAAEVAVGPGEHRAHGGAGLFGGEAVEAFALVGEFVDQFGDRVVRVGGDAFGGDAQRQRQIAAPLGQCAHGVRFAVGTVDTHD